MKIVGCDLHAKQQTIAMVDTETGEFTEKTLAQEGNKVREFYAGLEGPVVVGIEATGAMQWFLQLLEELGIECRVGHPAKIRAKETRKQKHDRRDAQLELELLMEDRFPTIWMPSSEQRDLRTLLRDRHQWVMRRCFWSLSHQMRCGIVPRLPNYLSVDLNPPENRLRIDTGRDGERCRKLGQVPCFGAGEIRPEFEIPLGDLPW